MSASICLFSTKSNKASFEFMKKIKLNMFKNSATKNKAKNALILRNKERRFSELGVNSEKD